METFLSQVGQDRWVCEKLEYKRGGYFVDVGAGDGYGINNSYVLESGLGWTGICVEANKERFEELSRRRTCICVNKAIYSHDGEVQFALSGGIFGVQDSLQAEVTENVEGMVECITMATLLDENNAPKLIDYVSLDTEGSDYEVLMGFPFDRYEVKLWTIEHNAYMDGGVLKDKIRGIMAENGYTLYPEEKRSHDVNIFEDWFVNEKYVNAE